MCLNTEWLKMSRYLIKYLHCDDLNMCCTNILCVSCTRQMRRSYRAQLNTQQVISHNRFAVQVQCGMKAVTAPV